jgi:hypothetical protein
VTEELTMALSTDDQTFAPTTSTNPPAGPPRADTTARSRASAIAGWIIVVAAVAAVAALTVAVLRPDAARPVDVNARTVARHGSVAAIDHLDQRLIRARTNTPSQTVARYGSVAAADHRDLQAAIARTHTVSQTVATSGSVAAVEHREERAEDQATTGG